VGTSDQAWPSAHAGGRDSVALFGFIARRALANPRKLLRSATPERVRIPLKAECSKEVKQITAGAFGRDQQIIQLVIADGLAELIDRGFERRSIVREERRTHDDVAVEIGEDPLRARLGAIDRDDAKNSGPTSWTRG
jgi:hypothetical protein